MAPFFSEGKTTALLVHLSANSALVLDAYVSALRPFCSAAQRGR
jgi:hypothetical protein